MLHSRWELGVKMREQTAFGICPHENRLPPFCRMPNFCGDSVGGWGRKCEIRRIGMKDERLAYSLRQAADQLGGVSVRSIQRLIANGTLPTIRVLRRVLDRKSVV